MKEMVLKSYHIYDNKNVHSPESFTVKSRGLIENNIDESVYKTFVNPCGMSSRSIGNLSLLSTGPLKGT